MTSAITEGRTSFLLAALSPRQMIAEGIYYGLRRRHLEMLHEI